MERRQARIWRRAGDVQPGTGRVAVGKVHVAYGWVHTVDDDLSDRGRTAWHRYLVEDVCAIIEGRTCG